MEVALIEVRGEEVAKFVGLFKRPYLHFRNKSIGE